jgi:hypothetical protein
MIPLGRGRADGVQQPWQLEDLAVALPLAKLRVTGDLAVGAPGENVGSVACRTTAPAAFLSRNLAGIVWPSLNLLCCTPVWCAVSLIGCRNPSQP